MDRKEEVNRIIKAGGLLIIAVVMSVISWMILPNAVAMQFPGWNTGAPAFPKFVAILIAFAFSFRYNTFRAERKVGCHGNS